MNRLYRSFLLRVWKNDEPNQSYLMASLEDPHTRSVLHFNSLDALMRYLKEQTAESNALLSTTDQTKENN